MIASATVNSFLENSTEAKFPPKLESWLELRLGKGTGCMLDRSHIFPALLLILNNFVNMFKG